MPKLTYLIPPGTQMSPVLKITNCEMSGFARGVVAEDSIALVVDNTAISGGEVAIDAPNAAVFVSDSRIS